MAVITLDTTTVQVRPWPAGGAWNNVTVVNRVAQKATTWGVTFRDGSRAMALMAANEMLNPTTGSHDRIAQETAHAVGIELRDDANLGTGLVGNGVTTNVLDRLTQSGVGTITIVTTVGATPTCTYQVEGSPDNGSFAPLSTADSATPTVFSTGTFVITTATTTVRIIDPAATNARFVRVTTSLNTNVTNTIDAAAG
jgi:hypothetical protein